MVMRIYIQNITICSRIVDVFLLIINILTPELCERLINLSAEDVCMTFFRQTRHISSCYLLLRIKR